MEIDDKLVESLVKNKVNERVNLQLRNMTNRYYSVSEFYEHMVKEAIKEEMRNRIPDFEEYVKTEINKFINEYKKQMEPLTRSEILNLVVNRLLDAVIDYKKQDGWNDWD